MCEALKKKKKKSSHWYDFCNCQGNPWYDICPEYLVFFALPLFCLPISPFLFPLKKILIQFMCP